VFSGGSVVEFRVLGPLEVVHAGELVGVGSAQQREVLALLVLRAPEPVSVQALIDELWGERPPATAQHAMRVYVSAIRRRLRTAAGEEVFVRTLSSGYALDVSTERIDARRFERLLSDAQNLLASEPARARRRFEEALALWRGPPLAEFGDSRSLTQEARRLEELQTRGVEGLVEARLAVGEHAEVIGALTGLLATDPLRERPRRLLMLALYRGGRHAEALAAYRDACTALDEIGLQPGPELRQLEQAILRHDPSLAAPRPAAQVATADPDPSAPVSRPSEERAAEAAAGRSGGALPVARR
jgi:DNA-binding SARP family transcriptional activator